MNYNTIKKVPFQDEIYSERCERCDKKKKNEFYTMIYHIWSHVIWFQNNKLFYLNRFWLNFKIFESMFIQIFFLNFNETFIIPSFSQTFPTTWWNPTKRSPEIQAKRNPENPRLQKKRPRVPIYKKERNTVRRIQGKLHKKSRFRGAEVYLFF